MLFIKGRLGCVVAGVFSVRLERLDEVLQIHLMMRAALVVNKRKMDLFFQRFLCLELLKLDECLV